MENRRSSDLLMERREAAKALAACQQSVSEPKCADIPQQSSSSELSRGFLQQLTASETWSINIRRNGCFFVNVCLNLSYTGHEMGAIKWLVLVY